MSGKSKGGGRRDVASGSKGKKKASIEKPVPIATNAEYANRLKSPYDFYLDGLVDKSDLAFQTSLKWARWVEPIPKVGRNTETDYGIREDWTFDADNYTAKNEEGPCALIQVSQGFNGIFEHFGVGFLHFNM